MINPSHLRGLIPKLTKRGDFDIPKLIVLGIGNPENDYHHTRHNVGLWAVNTILDKHQATLNHTKRSYDAWIGKLYGETIVVGKSKTYMNDSGMAARALLKEYKLSADSLLIIYDDMDIAPGNIRLKKQGGPGGHNGMKSICERLDTKDFPRLRIGIGRPSDKQDTISYVLSSPNPKETELITSILEKIDGVLNSIICDGLDTTMEWANRS
ncbi:MAG: aminoacyl-tRNA hydrolase [Dehalococcoidia bacterium]|nr:aminoacyl-tRNA hydrolase [Dehalococcoidia bacterium]MQG15432.1 aminoacyl-tRNA hydrolase [SAR202 cluster bacterium]|tara:strand:- start:257 stop:889 length:633 start_codon:yes stop_codon:yes gene_type:complete